MKKSRMLLLFGGLFLMLVGYVAWCGRTFYLRAAVPDLALVPDEVRALALSEIEAADLRRPEKFTMKRLSELLMHPYASDVPPVQFREVKLSGEFFSFSRGAASSGVFIVGRAADGKEWVLLTGPRGLKSEQGPRRITFRPKLPK
jgi:hypothetical protein